MLRHLAIFATVGLLGLACGSRPLGATDDDGSTVTGSEGSSRSDESTGATTSGETGSASDGGCPDMAILGRVVQSPDGSTGQFRGSLLGYEGHDASVDIPILTEEDGTFYSESFQAGRYTLTFLPRDTPLPEDEAYISAVDRLEVTECSQVQLGTRYTHRVAVNEVWEAGAAMELTISPRLVLHVPADGIEPQLGLPPAIGGKELELDEAPLQPFADDEELVAVFLLGNPGSQATEQPFGLEFGGDFGVPDGTLMRVYQHYDLDYDPRLLAEFESSVNETPWVETDRLGAIFVVRVG